MKTTLQEIRNFDIKRIPLFKQWFSSAPAHETKMDTDKPFFLFSILFWLILSFLTFLKAAIFQSAETESVHWLHIFSYTFTSGILWIPFTFWVWWLAKEYSFKKQTLTFLIATHGLLAMTMSFLQRLSSMSLDYLIQTKIIQLNGFPSYAEYLSGHFSRRWVEGILWYSMITVAVFGYVYIKNNLDRKEQENTERYLSIKKKGTQFRICLDQILFIESNLNYCFIHTDQTVYKMRTSLKILEQDLKGSTIKRIHNSYMVNTSKIFGYQHIQNGEYFFSIEGADKRISSTKTYRQQVKKVIANIEKNI